VMQAATTWQVLLSRLATVAHGPPSGLRVYTARLTHTKGMLQCQEMTVLLPARLLEQPILGNREVPKHIR